MSNEKVEAQLKRLEEEKLELELQEIESNLKINMTEDEYHEAEGSLYKYLVASWQVFESVPLKTNWHLGAIAEHLQACYFGEIRNLLVNVPPGSAKSSTISVAGPTWLWGPANAPQTKFMTASYGTNRSVDPATCDNIRSRRLMQTEWYKDYWGDRFHLMYDMNQKTVYENDKGGARLATSVGGGGTGLHYDILQIDDPLKAQEESSEAALERVIDWWMGTLLSRRRDPETARRIVIMQRLAEKDLAGHVEETESGWCVLSLPMEYEPKTWISPIGWQDPRRVEGELLFPERWSRATVETLKVEMGPYKYAAQYQQRPTPKGGGKIKRDWFRYYYTQQSHYDIVIQSWDLTFDDTEDAAFVVGEAWAMSAMNRYLLDERRDRMDIDAQLDAIKEMSGKWPQSRYILIEAKANGPAAIKMLKRELSTPIIAIDPKDYGGDKVTRLMACVPELKAGYVYLPHPAIAPWVKDYIHELTFFPKGRFKDRADTTSQALNWLAEHAGRRVAIATSQQEGGSGNPADLLKKHQQVEGRSRAAAREIFTTSTSQLPARPSRRDLRDIF